MKSIVTRVCVTMGAVMLFQGLTAQTKTNTSILQQAAIQQAAKEKSLHNHLQVLAIQKDWPLVMQKKNGGISMLTGIDDAGNPLYTSTDNNIVAAATLGTNKLWPGGSTGLNLTGGSTILKDRLAIWDGGSVRPTHVELNGRTIQRDVPSGISDHSTHVAGTMIASGVNPVAKGMSFAMQRLVCYDFNNHLSEMLNEAPNLLLSNHSYGSNAGWVFNDTQNRWEFWGLFGANEDYKFGYYSAEAQVWDSIAYNAPYYLIVKSAGNNRDENGPAVGQPYFRFNASGVMAAAGNRPDGISSNDSYDIIATYGVSKNILTIGAVNPISTGYNKPADVVISSFSSWGPTDDGRIKPDVVADGVNLLSSVGTSDNAYAVFSGTSMASPNTSGSLLLLQEYYNQLHGANAPPANFMRAATLKGLVIHTADEAGTTPGPDYQFGWGLIDMPKAAAVITDDNTTHTQLIRENTLNNGDTYTLPVIASGNGTLSATISWTDPKSEVVEPTATALDNPARKLVNDLDIVITKGATVYRPWKLNPLIPSAAATTGDNTLDNVEKIELPDVVPGDTYTIQVTHKGTLARSSQAYSLIASGVGGQAYCTSNPTSNAGARIDSVSFANIQNKNAAGCTTYSDFKNLIANLQPGQTIPFFARLNSCDATNTDKILKVFIDANNDGDFNDANETLATSGLINGDGNFTGNIAIPSIAIGKYTLLRIVMQETNVAANVTPCGNYTRGETQDYRALIVTPSIDAGITEVTGPMAGDCKSGTQYGTIHIRNFGSNAISTVPVSLLVKQGTTTIATLTGTFGSNIPSGSEVEYTFQVPFALEASTAYTFTAGVALGGDQVPSNDQLVTTVTTGANGPAPTGEATICNTSALLHATSTSATPFNWYASATATTPLATGTSTSTTTIQSTYYLGTGEAAKLGAPNKLFFSDGGYNQFSPGIRFTTTVPTLLKTARLYIGNPGKITFQLRQVVNYDESTGSYNYFPITSKTLDVVATKPTPPVLGNPDNDPNDQGAIYYLGINIPTADNYILAISYADGASIFRNNNITSNPYPFTVPGIISMTGNTAFQTGNPNNFQSFYYYLYDLNVSPSVGCPAPRAAITATTAQVPTISLAGNVFTSSAANGNQWLLNGNPIPGAVGNTYTATESGNYSVSVTTASGCTLTSTTTPFSVPAVPNVDPALIGLTVSPVPAKGQFDIKLVTRTKADLDIALISTAGQQVYHYQEPGFIGQFSKTIVAHKLAAGVYYIRVVHDKKMYIQKVILVY